MDGSIARRSWVARILVLAGAASAAAACGGGDSTGKDASTDGSTQGDATTEAGQDGAGGDATTDAIADSPTDVSQDAPPTVRRPFLVGSRMRAAAAVDREDWSDDLAPATDLDPGTRAVLARAWLEDGLQEHASIAAFARFAMMLLGVGAPPHLIAGAQRASLDEVRHAHACFSLARRYGAPASGPAALRVDDVRLHASLVELAALTAEEGCVGETLGALLAEEQAARASDPVARALLERIARDEARHAELAWQFLHWAVATGGEPVVFAAERAVARAAAQTLAMKVRPTPADPTAWAAHGRLTCAEARAIAKRGIDELALPAMRALAGGRLLPAA